MRVLRFLLRKEFVQIFRDRMIVRMLFLIPIVQLLILSNAATFEVKRARLVVVDHDRSSTSRGVVSRLTASGRFVLTATTGSGTRADAAMLAGRTDIILVIPAGFAHGLERERRAPVQLILNAEDGAAAGVMQTYASQILAGYAAELSTLTRADRVTTAAAGAAASAAGGPDGAGPRRGAPIVEVRQRGWYNAELEYRDFMVPAILVVLVTMIGTLLTAMNIVREKETGTLEQLNVTPITRPMFIAAKLIPLWSLALLSLGLGLGVARIAFDVPVHGSLAVVFLAAAVYLVGALGIGLWISTIVETQQQAMFVTFSIMMVYLLMSGVFTPVAAMPAWAQWIAEASPVKHFAVVMRAVLLKGAGLRDVARELAMLTGIGGVVLSLAVRQYRKRAA